MISLVASPATEDLLAAASDAEPWLQALLLALGTLLSEDLAAITGGILADAAPDNLPLILVACWAGMWCGDMVYYLLGYFGGKPALSLPMLRKIVSEEKFRVATNWFAERGLQVLLVTRVLPGTRPASYLAAGVLRFKPARFVAISLTLSFLWATLLIFLSMHAGHQLMKWTEDLRLGLLSPILTVLLILLFIVLLSKLPRRHWKKRNDPGCHSTTESKENTEKMTKTRK